jgi:hypothetical protein
LFSCEHGRRSCCLSRTVGVTCLVSALTGKEKCLLASALVAGVMEAAFKNSGDQVLFRPNFADFLWKQPNLPNFDEFYQILKPWIEASCLLVVNDVRIRLILIGGGLSVPTPHAIERQDFSRCMSVVL